MSARPFSIRQAFAVVPPMSKEITSALPAAAPKNAVARPPPAGPLSNMRIGKARAVSSDSRPPAECISVSAPRKPRATARARSCAQVAGHQRLHDRRWRRWWRSAGIPKVRRPRRTTIDTAISGQQRANDFRRLRVRARDCDRRAGSRRRSPRRLPRAGAGGGAHGARSSGIRHVAVAVQALGRLQAGGGAAPAVRGNCRNRS